MESQGTGLHLKNLKSMKFGVTVKQQSKNYFLNLEMSKLVLIFFQERILTLQFQNNHLKKINKEEKLITKMNLR